MVRKEIEYEMRHAMRNRDAKRRDFLRLVLSEFSRESKDISDMEALVIIKKMHKNATELDNDYEVKVLNEWMPKPLNEKQITGLVKGIISDGFTEMGKIMGELRKSEGVDMKLASGIVRELLK